MERKERYKQEDESYKDLPEVHIDPERRTAEQKRLSKKNFWILGIFIILCVAGVSAYLWFSGTLAPQSKENPVSSRETESETVKEPEDDTPPEWIGFQNRIVVEQNALDVDYSKYFLAVDKNRQVPVQVDGEVNLAVEGEYPITITAEDDAGNRTSQNVTVQVVSESTMATGVELSCYLDGSIPLDAGTKERLIANVIYFYYQNPSAEIQQKLNELKIDVSGYATSTTWNPSMLNVGTEQ